MTILFAILIFSFLIFIHELGHFVAAKLSGIQVNEFALFMGPAIWQKQVGETLYSLRCIPIGGYCAMEGEDGEEGESDNPRSFQKAAWWKRFLILVAGASMNFVAGVLIFAIVFLPQNVVMAPVIAQLDDCCVFGGADGLQVGDEILSIDGEEVIVNGDISLLFQLNPAGVHDVVVLRDGKTLVFDDLNMTHIHTNEDGTQYTHYGIHYGMPRELDLPGRFGYVWDNVVNTVRNVRLSLQMLLTGKAGLADMSGPVGIVNIMSDVAESSETIFEAVMNMLYFGGFLGINLAVMNLLPIPALDGGRVVGLLISTGYEAVTKKKLNPKYEGWIHGAGMVLLLILMGIIMFKDIFVIFVG